MFSQFRVSLRLPTGSRCFPVTSRQARQVHSKQPAQGHLDPTKLVIITNQAGKSLSDENKLQFGREFTGTWLWRSFFIHSLDDGYNMYVLTAFRPYFIYQMERH